MNEIAQIILGSFLISASLAFAWWTRLRIWMLRQELFAIRDGLWDRMHEMNMLDDPYYRMCRDVLNSMIRSAPALSWLTFWVVLTHSHELKISQAGSFSGETPVCVDKARSDANRCVVNYLLRGTIFGRMLWLLAMIIGTLGKWKARLEKAVDLFSGSEDERRLGNRLART